MAGLILLGTGAFIAWMFCGASEDDIRNRAKRMFMKNDDFTKLEEVQYGNVNVQLLSTTTYKLRIHDSTKTGFFQTQNMSMVFKEPGMIMDANDIINKRRIELYPMNRNMREICKKALSDPKILKKITRK